MRKAIFVAFAFVIVIFSGSNAYALGSELLDMRNSFFRESNELKPLMTESKDIILLSTMWDSCIITMTQLDAYFSMVGIYNAIKKENLTDEAIGYLINWLTVIKNTNDVNIKSLIAVSNPIDAKSKYHKDKLMGQFGALNVRVARELNDLNLVKKTIKSKK